MCAEPSTSEEMRVAPIPGSLSDACAQACESIAACIDAGQTRMFVEIDTSNGDETYTLLKNTMPVVRMVAPCLQRGNDAEATVRVFLPDSGAAALLLRDWPDAPPCVAVTGIEQDSVVPGDAAALIVTPRASEVQRLEAVVNDAGDTPVVVLCPDLIDMGVTGLSLNARKLRARFIDTFVSAYYLRTAPWGVVLRAYPTKWGLWVDAPGTPVGFRLVAQLDERPSGEDIEKQLSGDDDSEKPGGLGAFFGGISRFLKVYSQG